MARNESSDTVKTVAYKDSPLNHVHGLYIFDSVIDPETERMLNQSIQGLRDQADSIRSVVRARITLHFGHVFDAQTLKVATDDPTIEIPSDIRCTLDRAFRSISDTQDITDWKYDQMTINIYPDDRKSGIGAHTDTHSAFDDQIVVLSLGSPTVMRFSLPENMDGPSDPCLPILPGSLVASSILKESQTALLLPADVSIWIPARSLMIMSGVSRYLYRHRIKSRSTDTDPMGQIVKRGTRTSITVRKVRFDARCDCLYPISCDYQNPESLSVPDRIKNM
jgi:alkylated DNA repair protein alkB family protein 8